MGLTACTEPQCLYKGSLYFTVELYLYSPYGSYGLYRASVPVQGCTLLYSRAIPLLSLWVLRPVQSLSACARVHFTLPFYRIYFHTIGARGSAVGCGTALQVGRSWVRFPMVSLEFFIDIILPAALWPWSRLSL